MVLTDLTEFITDPIKKYLEFYKTLLEKGREFFLCDKHSSAVFNFPLILLSVVQGPVLQKDVGKRNLVLTSCFNGRKMVFILLAKVIAFNI